MPEERKKRQPRFKVLVRGSREEVLAKINELADNLDPSDMVNFRISRMYKPDDVYKAEVARTDLDKLK